MARDVYEALIPRNTRIIHYDTQEEATGQAYQGNAVLIPWEEWQDDLELIVVMDGNEKARDFRGAFLYNM